MFVRLLFLKLNGKLLKFETAVTKIFIHLINYLKKQLKERIMAVLPTVKEQ